METLKVCLARQFARFRGLKDYRFLMTQIIPSE
jgi:hypothetical protein